MKMKNSNVRQETGIRTTGFGRVASDPVEAPFNPKMIPANAAEKFDPQAPVQPVAERFPALEEREILFTLLAPDAVKVTVAGNFNNWRPEATPMKHTADGKWVARLMLRSGQYEYRFVVDGRWGEDPRATQRVANPCGGFNSVFTVPLSVRTSLL